MEGRRAGHVECCCRVHGHTAGVTRVPQLFIGRRGTQQRPREAAGGRRGTGMRGAEEEGKGRREGCIA